MILNLTFRKTSPAALTMTAALGLFTVQVAATPPVINPGAVWQDDRGQHIQAHGGGILKLGDTYYWFGEDRSRGLDPALRYVSCYSTHDLAQWTFRHQVVKLADPENLGPRWVLERPKVFYNSQNEELCHVRPH